MSREIKFSGLRKDGGGWAYGSLLDFDGTSYIVTSSRGYQFTTFPREIIIKDVYGVIPETVGQLVCFDRKKNEVYGGDKVKICDPDIDAQHGYVKYEITEAMFRIDIGTEAWIPLNPEEIELLEKT